MQKCKFCEAELPANARFCGSCGKGQPPEGQSSETHMVTLASSASDPTSFPSTPPPPPSHPSWPGISEQQPPVETMPPFVSTHERQSYTPLPPVTPQVSASNWQSPHLQYQPQMPHQQPQYDPGLHQQPQMPHQQPQYDPGLHQQPYMHHGMHQQPVDMSSAAGIGVSSSGIAAGPMLGTGGATTLGAAGHTMGAGGALAGKAAAGGIFSKWVIIIVTGIVIAGAGGGVYAFYWFTRPQPVVTVSSTYLVNGTPAGSNGTTIQIEGEDFAANAPLTFLLDGEPLAGAPEVQSDSAGKVAFDLPVTESWTEGSHTLTIQDNDSRTNDHQSSIMVVTQGQAGTPGPYSSPSDSASFTLDMNVDLVYTYDNESVSGQFTIYITGHSDPEGGTICADGADGEPITSQGTDTNGDAFVQTSSYICEGTYKNGKITYNETLQSETVVYSDGSTCILKSPQKYITITGEANEQGGFSGDFAFNGIPKSGYTCSGGDIGSFELLEATGTWTGEASAIENDENPGEPVEV